MTLNINNFFISKIRSIIQHYDHNKYWKYRAYVVKNGGNKLVKLWRLIYIKRCDAYNNSSTGTDWGAGAFFETHPSFPHGLNGIIIANGARIGKCCTIFHQVTIGNDNVNSDNVPIIGDNVIIYPGAKIVGKVSIGNNSVIGANTVVNFDVLENSLVVVQKGRIIERKK